VGESTIGIWRTAREYNMFEEFQRHAIQTKQVQHFGRFFNQIKVPQLIGRMILYKPYVEEAGDWRNFCMKRRRTLKSFPIFMIKIKKSKTYKR
jgi:hypothetical protein